MPHYIQWESLRADILSAAGAAQREAATGSQFAEGMYHGLMLALNFSNDPKHNPPAAGAGGPVAVGGGCYSGSEDGSNGASGFGFSDDSTYRTGGGGGVGGSAYVAVAVGGAPILICGSQAWRQTCDCGGASMTLERAVVRCARCGKPYDLIQFSEPLPIPPARSDHQR